MRIRKKIQIILESPFGIFVFLLLVILSPIFLIEGLVRKTIRRLK